MATRTITTKLALEGESEFKAHLQQLNAEFRLHKSELEKVQAQYAGQLNSLEALQAQEAALGGQLDVVNQKYAAYNKMLEQAQNAQARYEKQVAELRAEQIVPCLAHICAGSSQLPQHRQRIAGRAARVGLKPRVAMFAETVAREIHQPLPQGHLFPAMAHTPRSAKSRSYFSTSIIAEPPASNVMASASCRV